MTSKNISKSIHTTLGAIALIAATAATADAETTDNAPGAMCVATGSRQLVVRTDAEIENRSGYNVTAVCPAERELRPGTTTRLSGRVWVVDRNPNANVCCRTYSKNPGGRTVAGAWRCTSGSSSNYRSLTLPQIQDPYSWSHFFVQCKLPPRYNGRASRIQMYRTIQE